MAFQVEREIGGRKLKIETGKMARQACGAATVQYGDTLVLATVVDASPREGIDFFPLIVDYREKGYAAGLIFGGRFHKREGRPTDKEIVTMRAIDRPVRPLWPKNYDNEVLISIIVLSADKENDPDVLAMVASSAALWVSHLPFQGPTAAVRVGLVGDEFVLNPTQAQRKESVLNLIVTGAQNGVVMIEAGAKEISEDKLVDAVEFALPTVRELVEMQAELAGMVGVVRDEIPPPDQELSGKLAHSVCALRDDVTMSVAAPTNRFRNLTCLSALPPSFLRSRATTRAFAASLVALSISTLPLASLISCRSSRTRGLKSDPRARSLVDV